LELKNGLSNLLKVFVGLFRKVRVIIRDNSGIASQLRKTNGDTLLVSIWNLGNIFTGR